MWYTYNSKIDKKHMSLWGSSPSRALCIKVRWILCPENHGAAVRIPAVLYLLLRVIITAPSTKPLWQSDTTSTNGTMTSANVMAERGKEYAVATLRRIRCVSSALLTGGLHRSKKYTTSCRCPKAVPITRATWWAFVAVVTTRYINKWVTELYGGRPQGRSKSPKYEQSVNGVG